MRKFLVILLPVLVLALLAAGGWYWWTEWRHLQSTDDAYIQSDISLISPKIEGYIKEVRAKDNQPIAAGEVLFVIDDRDLAAKLAQAEAAVATAEAAVDTYESRLDLQRAVIDQAKAEVTAAEAEKARTERDYQRYKQLLSLVPLTGVYITANFKETQLTRMRVGQEADIFVDAYPERPLAGRVESFAPASGAQFSLLPPDNATGNFTKIVQRVPVRIAVPADASVAGLLRPRLSATVTADTRGNGEGP